MNKYTLFCALTLLVTVFLTSCNKDKEALPLQGTWQEQSYWADSTSFPAYDTLNHTTKLLHLECGETFTLELTTTHKINPSDPALGTGSFKEYVQGFYTASNGKLVLDGFYYTDQTFSKKADSINTKYSYGRYLWESDYKIDSKRLMIGIEDASRNDLNTFGLIESFECY